MGFYSRNRFSNMISESAPDVSGTIENESNNQEVSVSEAKDIFTIDDPEQNDVLEESYLDNIYISEKFGNLEETAIQLLENDGALFNTLIESDFEQATDNMRLSESVLEEVSDEIFTENLICEANNTSKIIIGISNAIKQAGAKTSSKLLELHAKDQSTFARFAKVLSIDNLTGFKGIDNFAFPSDATDKTLAKIASFDSLQAIMNIFSAKLNSESDRSSMKEAFDELKSSVDQNIKDFNRDVKEAFSVTSTWNPSKNDILILNLYMKKPNNIKKDIAEKTSNAVKSINNIEKNAKNLCKAATNNRTDDATYKANLIYQATSYILRAAVRKFNAYLNFVVKEYALYRKAALICGRYCNRVVSKKKVNTTNESTIAMLIGESSDEYVYEQFAY